MLMKINISKLTEAIFLFITSLFIWSCNNADDVKPNYCKMLELDQSHVNSDRSNEKLFNSDKQARHEIFRDNFNQIIQYSKINGFPEMGSLKASGLDSCRNWAVMITLFHVGQSQPKLFFDAETKEILKKEIIEGRLKSGSLFPPLREGFRSHEFCIEKKDEIIETLISWQIKIDDLPEMKFVKCSE